LKIRSTKIFMGESDLMIKKGESRRDNLKRAWWLLVLLISNNKEKESKRKKRVFGRLGQRQEAGGTR